jgi:P27 family predicted phage terminase small subunit
MTTRARWLRNPEGLSEPALKLWHYYAPGLASAGLVTAENAEMLRSLVRLLAVCQQADADIARDGTTIALANGSTKQHPAVQTLLAAQKAAEPLLEHFGLHEAEPT